MSPPFRAMSEMQDRISAWRMASRIGSGTGFTGSYSHLKELTMADQDEIESAAEDLAQQYALTDDGLLKVYSAGPVTVLGFGGQDVPSEFNAAHYRAAISDLVRLNQSTIVAFDLTGVRLVPSGMLGLLVSLTRIEGLPLKIQVFNPSTDVKEVLSITKLNRMIELHEVELGGNSGEPKT